MCVFFLSWEYLASNLQHLSPRSTCLLVRYSMDDNHCVATVRRAVILMLLLHTWQVITRCYGVRIVIYMEHGHSSSLHYPISMIRMYCCEAQFFYFSVICHFVEQDKIQIVIVLQIKMAYEFQFWKTQPFVFLSFIFHSLQNCCFQDVDPLFGILITRDIEQKERKTLW